MSATSEHSRPKSHTLKHICFIPKFTETDSLEDKLFENEGQQKYDFGNQRKQMKCSPNKTTTSLSCLSSSNQ